LVSSIVHHDNIFTATDGKQALEQALTTEFNLILMDLNMPVMGGLEATTKIRELEKSANRQRSIIIAISSSSPSAELQEQCHEAGMNEYLCSPVKFQTLKTEVLDKYF